MAAVLFSELPSENSGRRGVASAAAFCWPSRGFADRAHLLIGLSLLIGLMVRVSAAFGILLMTIYWFAHMDWPFIENTNSLAVDYHPVYAGVLGYLIVKRAGHVFGLDALVEKMQFVQEHPALKPLVA